MLCCLDCVYVVLIDSVDVNLLKDIICKQSMRYLYVLLSAPVLNYSRVIGTNFFLYNLYICRTFSVPLLLCKNEIAKKLLSTDLFLIKVTIFLIEVNLFVEPFNGLNSSFNIICSMHLGVAYDG